MKIALITIHWANSYGGTLQALASQKILSKYGDVTIIDYKTPASDSKTWGPQVAAYRHLAEKNRPEKYVGCMALQPKKDGGTARAYTYQRSGEMFQIYLSALNCYRYFSA